MSLFFLASLLLLFGAAVGPAHAFTSPTSLPTRGLSSKPPSKTSLNLQEWEIPQECMTARGDCVFWFFGASGAAGIARSAFPRMFSNFVNVQKIKNDGPTKGGEGLGIVWPLCFYPRDLYRDDVQQLLDNPLTVSEIVEQNPIEGNFLTAQGYLAMQAFEMANPSANPLTTRAVFDTFAVNTDLCDPNVAQRKLDRFRNDMNAFVFDFYKSKFVGLSAILTLLFLLGIADIIAFTDVYHGWFPDWPGGVNFPFSMFTEENGSPFNIPAYWI